MTARPAGVVEAAISVDTSAIRAALAGVGVSGYRTPEQHRAAARGATSGPPSATAMDEFRRTFVEPPDMRDYDDEPGYCWRCDAREGAGDIGLCGPCHTDLVE